MDLAETATGEDIGAGEQPQAGDDVQLESDELEERGITLPQDVVRMQRLNDARERTLFFVMGGDPAKLVMRKVIDAHPEAIAYSGGHFPNQLYGNLIQAYRRYNKTLRWVDKAAYEGDGSYELVTEPELQYLLRQLVYLQLGKPGLGEEIKAIGEATPENSTEVYFLASTFPECRLVHYVADPRDRAVTAARKAYDNYQAMNKDFDRRAAALGVLEVMRVWAFQTQRVHEFSEEHPERVLTVTVNDIADNAALTLERTYDFLGLDSSIESVGQVLDDVPTEQARGSQELWEALGDGLLQRIEDATAEHMDRYGFERLTKPGGTAEA